MYLSRRIFMLAVMALAWSASVAPADGPFRRVLVRQAPPPPEVLLPPAGAPVLPPPALVRPPTHAEFARQFQPAPGRYEVVLLHPCTNCPVQVCFTLPPGCPKRVRVERRELEFDYGRCEVEIRFYRNGTARVEYND